MYDGKNKKNSISEALISDQEKEMKEEPSHKITYAGKYGTRPKDRPKERNCRFCNAPNWNRNPKCPSPESIRRNCKKVHIPEFCRSEHRKQQKIEEITELDETEEIDPDKCVKIIFKIKYVTDPKLHILLTEKNDGTKHKVIVDNVSTVTIIPPIKEI